MNLGYRVRLGRQHSLRPRSHADILRSADREDQPGNSRTRAPSHVGAQDAIGAILMLPNGVLSTVPVPAAFRPPHDRVKERLIDYELGGRAIQDSSEGLEVKVWTAEADEQTGSIMLSAPGVTPVEVLVVPGVQEISLTFDQNMQPALAYLTADGAFLYWFDTTLPGFTTLALPAGSHSPRITLDDKRATQTANSDIILAYMRGGALYYRQQRDRFLIEYELANGLHGAELDQIGMNTLNRLQFRLLGGPTSQHAPVSVERIVRDLAARCGVVDVDAGDLTEVYVDGYQITALTTGRAAIEPLRMVGAFDMVERGTTLRFPTRGKAPVATLTEDELGVRSLDTDPGPAITTRKAQDVELPRQIRLRYPSLSRDYEIGEQLSPARMGTVGVNDVSVDCPVVMTDSTAAQIAERLFREAWASRHAHSFTVGAQHHALE